MSKQSLDGRLRGLEERLELELNERRRGGERAGDSPILSLGVGPGRPGSVRRPRPPPMFTGGELSAFPPCTPHTTETDVRMREVYKVSGKLNVEGVEYRSQVSDLKQLGELGSGSCGHVVEMLHKPSGAVIAVKQMRRSGNSEETKRILMDLDVVVRSHDCPYIVRCLGCFVTEADVWICMELMASCFDKLLKRLGAPIPEDILGKVTVATVSALSYLKENHGVIHRDVKPSNILLDARGNVKLCDFGISGRLVDSKAKTRSAGCAAYMAPERIDPPDPTRPDYDIRADVWSLGISLVELATGVFPYRDCQNDFEVLTRVIEEDPPKLPNNGQFSSEFMLFVHQCLTKDYRDRPKYTKLLKHPFVVKSARSDVSVGAWYAGLPGTSPTAPRTPVPTHATHTTLATHTVGTPTDNEVYQIPLPRSYAPSQIPLQLSRVTYDPPVIRDLPVIIPVTCHMSPPPPRPHVITNGLSPVSRDTMSPRLPTTQTSPQTTPPASVVSSVVAHVDAPRPFDRLNTAPAWMSRDQHATPTPTRSCWTTNHMHGGSSSQPASLEAELGSYSPFPRRRTLETCASPPPPPPPARRVSADSRWRPSPAGSGNTSPIVLQRFYHQSQQRRSRADLHATPRHRSLSREHSTGRSPEPPPRSSRHMLGHDVVTTRQTSPIITVVASSAPPVLKANGSSLDVEREPPALHERLQLHDRLSEGRSQSLTRAELRNGWRAEHAPPASAAHAPPLNPSTKHHHDDQGWLHSLAGLVKRRLTNYVKWHHVVGSAQQPLQPTRQLSRAPRWGGAESWSVPASPLPPRAPPPRPAD